MGILEGIAGSAISGAVGSLIGGISANSETERQRSLMALQQKYARENAATANHYARQNAMDAPMLERLGKEKAGINTAFGQNGSVISVGQGALAGAPTPPAPLGLGSSIASLQGNLANSITSVSKALLQQEEAKKAASERQQVDIDNITRAAENVARIGKIGSEASKASAEAALTNLQTKFKQDTYDDDKSFAHSSAVIQQANADTQKDMNLATIGEKIAAAYRDIASGALSYQEIENKKEEIKNLQQEREEISSRIDVNKSTVKVNNSIVKLNGAKAFEAMKNGDLAGSKKVFQDLQNSITSATKADMIKLAHREAAERGPQSVNQWTWDRLNRWDELTSWQKVVTFFGLLGSAVGEVWNGAAVGAVQGGAMGFGFNKGQKIATPKRNPIGFK